MSLGFRVDETMSGEHEFEDRFGDPGRRPLSFTVTWGVDDLRSYLDPRGDGFLVSNLQGTITVDGLCNEAPCTGTLELRYFKDHTIRYTIEFEVDGEPYRFVGEKMHIYPWNLPWSHTTCYGRLTRDDTGELVSTSLTHFRLIKAPAFLGSLRLA